MRRHWVLCVSIALATLLSCTGRNASAGLYFNSVLQDNPAYYWTFDEASGTALNYGSAAGGNLGQAGTATRTVSTSTTGGVSLGTTAEFDGSNAGWFYTAATGGTALQGPAMDSYAVEMWTRATVTPGAHYLFEVGTGNSPSVIYGFNPSVLELYAVSNGRTGATGPTALADGQWHHVVIGYKDNGASGDASTFIIDGGTPATYTLPSNQQFLANGQHLIVGADINGGSRYGGNVDELAVYNLSSLSQAQFDSKLAAIASHGTLSSSATTSTMTAYTWQVLKDNPRFYWNFNEPSSQGNALDLVRHQANDELVSSGGARRKPGATANLGNSAGFDGNNLFNAAGLNDGEMPGAWSIEMWVKADGSLAGSRGDYLMAAGTNNANPAVIYDYGVGGDNKVELHSAAGRTAGGGPSLDDNEWHHLVATFYGNGAGFGVADRVDFALDGVVYQNVPRGGFSSGFDLINHLTVGAANAAGAGGFQGQIDEVAFYDLSGLSVAQVTARTQQIAGHYSLASQGAGANLRYIPGVTYQIDAATPAQIYGAPFNVRLTDGEIGSTGSAPWDQGNWVGWLDVDPRITFDLHGSPVLDSIFIDYLGGSYTPDTVLVEFSLDGSDFSAIPSILSSDFNDSGTGGQARRLVLETNDAMARFVRMTFTRDDP